MARAPFLTEDEQEDIAWLYSRGGHTVASLAARFHVGETTVRRVLAARQVDRRPNHWPANVDVSTDQLRALREQGWSLTRIGRHVGMSPEGVRKRLLE